MDIKYVWKKGDSFSSLAFKYYGNIKYWRFLVKYNGYIIEWQPEAGDIIKIPKGNT